MRKLSYVEQVAVSGGRLYFPPDIEAMKRTSKPKVECSVATYVSTATSTEVYNFIGSISHNSGVIIGNISAADIGVIVPEISNNLSIEGYSSLFIND